MNLIFDVDGTLWDSTERASEAFNHVISTETNLPIRTTGFWLKKLFGKPMDEICAEIFQGLPKAESTAIFEQCMAHENQYLETHPGTLYEGVEETLKELAKDHKLYICSNCQKGYIEVFLRSTGLEPLFSGHLCFGDTGTPKGETIRRLMEAKGMEKAIYIGDTQGDANASKEAGIPFIYCAYGFGRVIVDYPTVEKIGDLPALLEEF